MTLRHDNGSVYTSEDFQQEIRFYGLTSSPSFVRAPEGNGCAERFIRTLKQQLLWLRFFPTVEAFRERYNAIRPHWALVPALGRDAVTPTDVYCRGVEIQLPAWQGWARAAKRKLQGLVDQGCEAA